MRTTGRSPCSQRLAHHVARRRFSNFSKRVACQNLPTRPEVRDSTLVEHEKEVAVFDEAEPISCHSIPIILTTICVKGVVV